MFPHPSLQQHKEQGALKKHKNNFVQIPAVLFTNLTSSEGWKTAGRSKKQSHKKQKTPKPTKTPALPPPPQKASPKNDMGTTWSLCPFLYTQPTFVHPALLLILKTCSCSFVHGDKLLQLLMQVGQTAPSATCCPNQTECSACQTLHVMLWLVVGERTGGLPEHSINSSPFQVNTLWV